MGNSTTMWTRFMWLTMGTNEYYNLTNLHVFYLKSQCFRNWFYFYHQRTQNPDLLDTLAN
jgi:hypothetical protein